MFAMCKDYLVMYDVFVLADGIALGAAAQSSQMHVEMIVFVAIMLHKVSKACSFWQQM